MIFPENVTCVCGDVVKVDDTIKVSRLLDLLDLRTNIEVAYCRGCVLGKHRAHAWLFEYFSEED